MNFYCTHLAWTAAEKENAHRFPYHTVVLMCCDECINKFMVGKPKDTADLIVKPLERSRA